jgi:hypothetical protein
VTHGTDKNEKTKEIARITTTVEEMWSVQIHTAFGGHHTAEVRNKHDGILHSTQYNQVSLKDLVMKGDLVLFVI